MGYDMNNNGWAEHKLHVYGELENIKKENTKQTQTLKAITDSIGDMRNELGIFKTNVKWTVTIVTILISSVIGMAIRLIAG